MQDLVKEREELKARILELQSDIIGIQLQLDGAAKDKFETGKYADAKWFHGAKTAKAHKVREVLQLQAKLSQLRVEIRRQSLLRESALLAAVRALFDYYQAEGGETVEVEDALDALDVAVPYWARADKE